MKRVHACLVGLLIAPAAFGQATTLRFEIAPRLALPLPRVRDPRVALRASRELIVLAIQDLDDRARLVALTSTDGGDSFSDPTPVSAPGAWVFGTGESGPALTLGSRGLCAGWHQARRGGGVDIMVAFSETGARWSKPTRLTDREGVHHGYVALTAAPNGQVYAAWLDGRERSGGVMDVFLARSGDGGKTFGKNIRVGQRASHACRPAVAVTADGAVHVAWRGHDTSHVRDVFLATSRDGGRSFSEARCISPDGWKPGDTPRSGPTLAASGSNLHLAWFSEGQKPGIRWTLSPDNGGGFAPAMVVSQGVLDANHPTLSVSGSGRVHLTFQGRPDGGDGWLPEKAYVAEVTSWVSATRGPLAAPGVYDKASYPTGQFDASGRLWMFWTAGEAILLSRAREQVAL